MTVLLFCIACRCAMPNPRTHKCSPARVHTVGVERKLAQERKMAREMRHEHKAARHCQRCTRPYSPNRDPGSRLCHRCARIVNSLARVGGPA